MNVKEKRTRFCSLISDYLSMMVKMQVLRMELKEGPSRMDVDDVLEKLEECVCILKSNT